MKIRIDKINTDEMFLVDVKYKTETKHYVKLTDETHFYLTRNKISKIKLIELSFFFLLERENNTSILPKFNLEEISEYFPEYLENVKKWTQ